MIALAIFAVVSGALIRNAAQAIRQTSVIQQKTLAYWIAENQLNQMRASPRLEGSFPSIGSERYSVTMADRDWEVIMDVEATENSDMRRIKVSVFAEDDPDEYIAELVGFRGKY
jgi:general secretion pathway protein I